MTLDNIRNTAAQNKLATSKAVVADAKARKADAKARSQFILADARRRLAGLPIPAQKINTLAGRQLYKVDRRYVDLYGTKDIAQQLEGFHYGRSYNELTEVLTIFID